MSTEHKSNSSQRALHKPKRVCGNGKCKEGIKYGDMFCEKHYSDLPRSIREIQDPKKLMKEAQDHWRR